MKKTILLLIFFPILIFSCKKSNSVSADSGLLEAPYYLSCKVGGSDLNFTSMVSCHLPTGGDTVINGTQESSVTFNLSGIVNSSNDAQINITLTGAANLAITTKSYIYPSVQIGCNYTISNTNQVAFVGYYVGGSDSLNYSQNPNEFQLTVTAIDKIHKTIMGNFDGILAGSNGITLQIDTLGISNGKFYLPYSMP